MDEPVADSAVPYTETWMILQWRTEGILRQSCLARRSGRVRLLAGTAPLRLFELIREADLTCIDHHIAERLGHYLPRLVASRRQ